jgi:MFS family permease
MGDTSSTVIQADDQPAIAVMPWYRSITAEQWKTLVAAFLGWMLDAMDFVLYLMAVTTLQREFDYDTAASGLLATVALLASAVGGVVFGVVADRFGRTRALMATIVIYSFCSLGTATAQNLAQLLVWRALLGLGIGGEWASGAVLISETWPAEHRDKAMGIMQSGWALGYILAAVAAAIVLPLFGWRALFVVGALPALLVFWLRREVHEPQVWLARRQREISIVEPLRMIFGRALFTRTLLGALLFGTVMFAYWGLFTWLPAFLALPIEEGGAGLGIVNSLSWIVTMQLGAFAGYLSFGFVADRLGRRRTFILYLVAAAALVPIYGHGARSPTTLLLLGPLVGFFGHGYFSLFGTLLAELFPTAARATGQGVTYSVARGLSALAPYTVGVLANIHGVGPALTLTSAFFLTGAVLILLLPRPESAGVDDNGTLPTSLTRDAEG